MAKRKPKPREGEPPPELVVEVREEMLERVKETAERIKKRVKKVTDETAEQAKLDDTKQHPPVKE